MNHLKRFSPYFLCLAVIVDFLFPYFLEAQLPRYNPLSSIISNLGEVSSPVSAAFMYCSLFTGCFFILGSLGVPSYFQNEFNFIRYPLAIAIAFYGLGDCIISGLVHMNKQEQTFSNPTYFLHAMFTGLAMIGLLIVPIICTLKAFLYSQRSQLTFYLSCLIGTFLSLFLFSAYYLPILGPVLTSTRGLWQELALCFLYLPIVGLAVKERMNLKRKTYTL